MKKQLTDRRRHYLEDVVARQRELVEKKCEILDTKYTAEEKTNKIDKLYLQEQEHETKLNSELKLLSERIYKIIQEIVDLKTKEKNLEAEVNVSIVTINNLQSKTNKFIETTRSSLSSGINITSTNYSIISIDLTWFVYGIH